MGFSGLGFRAWDFRILGFGNLGFGILGFRALRFRISVFNVLRFTPVLRGFIPVWGHANTSREQVDKNQKATLFFLPDEVGW